MKITHQTLKYKGRLRSIEVLRYSSMLFYYVTAETTETDSSSDVKVVEVHVQPVVVNLGEGKCGFRYFRILCNNAFLIYLIVKMKILKMLQYLY